MCIWLHTEDLQPEGSLISNLKTGLVWEKRDWADFCCWLLFDSHFNIYSGKYSAKTAFSWNISFYWFISINSTYSFIHSVRRGKIMLCLRRERGERGPVWSRSGGQPGQLLYKVNSSEACQNLWLTFVGLNHTHTNKTLRLGCVGGYFFKR